MHGQMFFVSYTLDRAAGAPSRPLTFVWNGGPGSNAALVHLIGFGPKRLAPRPGAKPDDGSRWIIEANPGTWLEDTDLVFVDPIGTGYSRATRAEYTAEFYQTRGDAESVAEFIRVYRTRSTRSMRRCSSPARATGSRERRASPRYCRRAAPTCEE